jgi:acyl-CoA dehydrogenase
VGLATEAVRRAVAVTRRRSRGATAPDNPALAQAHTRLAGARGQLAGAVAGCEPVLDHGQTPTMTLAAELNALKVGVSEAVVDVVRLALEVTGMAGFTEDGPYSVARILRDVHTAPLMISNHRLLATNSQLLLALRGER